MQPKQWVRHCFGTLALVAYTSQTCIIIDVTHISRVEKGARVDDDVGETRKGSFYKYLYDLAKNHFLCLVQFLLLQKFMFFF